MMDDECSDKCDFLCLMLGHKQLNSPTEALSWIIDSRCPSLIFYDQTLFVNHTDEINSSVKLGNAEEVNVLCCEDGILNGKIGPGTSMVKPEKLPHFPNF